MLSTNDASDIPTMRRQGLRWPSPLTPARVHYAALGMALVFLLILSSRSWFFGDDWAFLVPSQEQIWAPHVGHWSTTPFLLFLGLRDVFGIDSYLPFVIPVIIAQLALAHLIWRFCLTVGVRPAIATTFSLLLMWFGAGSENVLWAFQVGFVGAMVFAMLVVLILLKPTLRWFDIVLIIVLSILSLTSSGTSIPVLIVAALIGWNRHGFLRAAGVLAVPAVVYGVWFVLLGRFAPPAGRATGLIEILMGVPSYALKMLTDGLGRAFPIEPLGPILFAIMIIWGVISVRFAPRKSQPAYLLFLAAPLFALVTGYSRYELGIDTATSSRYLFFVIPMMLPLIGLALTATLSRSSVHQGAVVVLLLVVVLYNAGGLVGTVLTRDNRSESTRERLSAAAALESSYPGADLRTVQPGGQWAPDVLLSDLKAFQREGWLRPTAYDVPAELTARGLLGLVLNPTVTPSDATSCTAGPVAHYRTANALIHVAKVTTMTVELTKGTSVSDPITLTVRSGWSIVSLSGAVPAGVGIDIENPEMLLTSCAVPLSEVQ